MSGSVPASHACSNLQAWLAGTIENVWSPAFVVCYRNSLSGDIGWRFPIFTRNKVFPCLITLAVLASVALPVWFLSALGAEQPTISVDAGAIAAGAGPVLATNAAAVPPPRSPTIAQTLESGVLIVISKASQRMHVFRDGQPMLSTQVSTGRRGHRTPSGVFPIIEKRRYHRSNIYSNAPMPFMQRMTMRGIAIHAGHLPGYPASHGCIRVSYGVARSLFAWTRVGRTTVVVLDQAIRSDDQARELALAVQPPRPGTLTPAGQVLASSRFPVKTEPAQPTTPASGLSLSLAQTIQLAAALSPQEAEAHWRGLLGRHPELGRFDKAVVPVTIGPRRYFRLRASGPGAFAFCAREKSAGLDCFRVL